VLAGDPGRRSCGERDGLKMPVATTPIWMAAALTGDRAVPGGRGRASRADGYPGDRARARAMLRPREEVGRADGALRAAREKAQPAEVKAQCEKFRTTFSTLKAEIGKVIVGHQRGRRGRAHRALRGGNVLLEGVPGLGKTLLVRTLARP
jgi:hypothetical protein